MKKCIGVIGFGDLGSQLVGRILDAGFEVIVFDVSEKPIAHTKIRVAASTQEVLEVSRFVHWAVPSKSLDGLESIPDGVTVILHDSVMNNSLAAANARSNDDRFAIVHCLMNDEQRVFVASEGVHDQPVMEHLTRLGLRPKPTSVSEHDHLMARSQGVLALLVGLGLREELDRASLDGDLTPSAEELHRVLMNRELNWTQHTLSSILSNPGLGIFTQDLDSIIKNRRS